MAGEAERLAINAILQQDDLLAVVEAGVDQSWFHSHEAEWAWIQSHWRRYRKIPSRATFRQHWPEFDLYRDVAPGDLAPLLDNLRDSHIRTSLAETMRDVAERIHDREEDPERLVGELIQRSSEIRSSATGDLRFEGAVPEDWQVMVDEIMRRKARLLQTGQVGLPLGFDTFDLRTGGPAPGELWVVAARLGQGKTWTLLKSIAMAVISGQTVQLASLEMSRAQVQFRLQAILAFELGLVPHMVSDLIHGHVDPPRFEEYSRKLAEKLGGKAIINDTPRSRVSVDTLAAQIERNRPSALYVDYLTLLRMEGDGDWKSVGKLSADLKGLATEYEIPVIAAAQLNRVAGEHDHPGPEHLSQSDQIGQDSDGVITIKKHTKRVLKMKLAKWRAGEDGAVWWVRFEPNSGQIREIDGSAAQDLQDDDRAADL